MHQDIRKLATNLNVKLQALQVTSHNNHQQAQIDSVNNLKECIQSAASVLSSASTVLSEDQEELSGENVDFMSDFGDLFDREFSQSTLDWIYSTPTDYVPNNLIDTMPRRLMIEDSFSWGKNSADMPTRADITSHSMTLSTPSVTQYDQSITSFRDRTTGMFSPESSIGKLSMSETVSPSDSMALTRTGTSPLSNVISNQTARQQTGIADTHDPIAKTSQQGSKGKVHSPPKETTRPAPKEKRLSFTRLFSKKPAKPKMRENPVTGMRWKAVFVGDGASGKTCFLV